MRYLLLAFALLFSIVASAQVSDVVNLSIELKGVQTIKVNPLQKNVNLVYDSQEKYEGGIISTQTEHLEIFTTGGGWAVQVSSLAFDFNVDVTIVADPLKPNPTYEFTPAALSQTQTDLITGIRGGRQAFNITYDNSEGANKYTDLERKIYTTEVTYTLMTR